MELKKVIELIRVSTAGQAASDKAGIAAQRLINRRTAQLNGLTIVKTIEMVDIKGADIMLAPAMHELLSVIESPEIRGVVTKEFTRLMRPQDPADFVILGRFLSTKTLLYLPDSTIDFSTPAGFLLGIVRAGMAGMEAIEIRNRTNDAKEVKRLAGHLAGGRTTLPYAVNYDRKTNRWSFDAPKLQKVRAAFRAVLSGEWNLAKVARSLHIPRTNLRYILQNRIYTGVRVYEWMRDPNGHVRGPDGKRRYTRKIRRPEDRRCAIKVLPPAISEEDFERVQKLLALKKKSHWRSQNKPRPNYLFAGFLWCARCGSRLYGHTSVKPHYVCKACTTRERKRRQANGIPVCNAGYVLRDRLEKYLSDLLSKELLKDVVLREIIGRLKRHLDNEPHLSPTTIEKEIRRLLTRRNRVRDSYWDGDGRFTVDEIRTELDRVTAEINTLEGLLKDARELATQEALLTPDMIRQLLRPLARWRLLTPEQRVDLLKILGTRIIVDRYVVVKIEFELLGESPPGRAPPVSKLSLPLAD